MTAKPVDSKDPHKDLRVVWSGDNKRIVVDRRPSRLQRGQLVKRVKVLGPRRKQ